MSDDYVELPKLHSKTNTDMHADKIFNTTSIYWKKN